ncbi:MAG: hypothetical protein H6744_15000 [Deltaproteobacteria bacterium]|nr:hypothetical protein [Deltaproteobacteria bacterium]MCB9787988.1 hypothetical protein [Deltaproteobacteria bacterium]
MMRYTGGVSMGGSRGIALATLMLAASLSGPGCDTNTEMVDNEKSAVVCADYCAKKFDCEDRTASVDEDEACVAACRDSIEDGCGNDHQAAANARLAECVDKGCTEFWDCLVFAEAPECFNFVAQRP